MTIAQQAAHSLRYRMGGRTDAAITDDMIKAVAWFNTYSDNTRRFKAELLNALDLTEEENEMGAIIIVRK